MPELAPSTPLEKSIVLLLNPETQNVNHNWSASILTHVLRFTNLQRII